MYDQGSEFIGHEFRKSLIEAEYGITTKPSTLVNPMSNALLEHIHQVLVTLVRTYNINQTCVDADYPLSVILDVAAVEIQSITNRLKYYSPCQLIFGRDMIPPIKHRVDWELIHQKK